MAQCKHRSVDATLRLYAVSKRKRTVHGK